MNQALPALLATLVTQILVSCAVLVGPVLVPLAAADLGVDAANIGFFVSVQYVFGACAGVISGGFIARFGPVRVSQAALVLVALGLCFEARGAAWALPLAAFALGLGVGPPTPASSTILARVTPARIINLVFSLKQTGVPFGGALAGILMPALAVAYGWQAAALAAAALCVTMAALLQPMRARYDDMRNRALRLHLGRQFLGPLRMILADPKIRHLTTVSFVFSGMQACMTSILVTYLVHMAALDVVEAGFILMVAQVAAGIARVSTGTLADTVATPSQVLGGMGLVAAVCAVTATQFTPAWPHTAILGVCIVFGISSTGWNGVFLAQIARMAPKGRAGELTGGATFMTFSGVVVMPALFSTIIAASGSYAAGFLVIAVATFAAALSLLLRPLEAPVLDPGR